MNKKIVWMVGPVLLVLIGVVFADEKSSEISEEDAPMFTQQAPDPEELEGAEEVPLELDPISVSGQGLNFKQEVALRIVRQAYNAPRSDRHEDIDNWICWLDAPVGGHFKYLSCARNGDLRSLRPSSAGGAIKAGIPIAGYGKIYRSSRPANRWKLERAMAELPGSSDFDREFLGMVMAGEQPDRDIPDEEEVDQFARAWVEVGKLNKAGDSEQDQVAAIVKEGLSLERYNRIADLTETYQSVENQVDERIKKLR